MFKSLFLSCIVLLTFASMAISQNLVIDTSGTFSGSGTYVVHGNIDNTNANSARLISGTVRLAKNGAQSIGGSTNAINFQTLQIDSAGTKTTSVDDTVQTTLDVAHASGVFSIGTKKLTLEGAITNSGSAASPYTFN